MTLLNSGMLFSKTKMVFWYPVLKLRFLGESVENEFLKDSGDYWEEADWPVRGNICGWFSRF